MASQNGGSEQVTKLYVEITGRCNLKCRMCMLTTLEQNLGLMSLDTFKALLEQLKTLPAMPMLHFSGYGEPTGHPEFLEMVRLAKAAGAQVGITTNGTLLTAEMSTALVKLGLDKLVVSIDGVKPEHYQDIRLGSLLPEVIENLKNLRRIKIRLRGRLANPQVGIAFVAMKRNFEDLAQLPALAAQIGANEILVSNVIPFTPEMESEILYENSLNLKSRYRSNHTVSVSLPKFDVTPQTLGMFHEFSRSHLDVSLLDADLSARDNYCQFIEKGYAVIRWDGALSPCLALMHEHDEYIRGRRHHVKAYSAGNINDTPFIELWNQPEYQQFRQRVHRFEFSCCSSCAACANFNANQIDCMEIESPSPVCGGCLWARGLVQCP